jgi:hypothetical protein
VFEKPELILLTVSAGGREKTEPSFLPPRPEAEAKRTISSFSRAVAGRENHKWFSSLAANSFSYSSSK